MAKKAAAGAPLWIVTFADLMSLLVCFFVLIISFSVPDIEKLKIAAGSIRDAFGFTREIRVTGVVELEGNPMFKFAEQVQPLEFEDVVGPIPQTGRDMSRLGAFEDHWIDLMAEDDLGEAPLSDEVRFEQIEQELREVVQLPELATLAQNLKIEQTPEGLRIQLLDPSDTPMFPLGSATLYEPARLLVRTVGAAIKDAPNRIVIAGHTDARPFRNRSGYDNWSLSLGRADATRRELLAGGMKPSRVDEVAGKAATDPMIKDDPNDPRNRRISIMLLRQPGGRPEHPTNAAAAAERRAAGSSPETPARNASPSRPEADEATSIYSIVPRFSRQ